MWIIWALAAALSAALVVILTKAGLKNVEPNLAFAIQSVMIIIVAWGVAGLSGDIGELHKMDRKAWIFILAAGVATSLSTIFSYQALKVGQASYVTTIERLSLVFSIFFAVLFLKEKISWQLVTGAVIMLGGAVLIALSSKSE